MFYLLVYEIVEGDDLVSYLEARVVREEELRVLNERKTSATGKKNRDERWQKGLGGGQGEVEDEERE